MTPQKLKYGIAAAVIVGAAIAGKPTQDLSKFKDQTAHVSPVLCTDMPVPSYSWVGALGSFISDRSKKSDYTGQ